MWYELGMTQRIDQPEPSAEIFNGARTTIEVIGTRVHNLKDVSIELPRDKLIVITGLSGSGKSSLAFDTIYAEGQRRYMESLSSYARRFIAQVEKPDVDFVYGLSPVVSIEQKTMARNPRSTVGTLTDISSYLNLLFATIAEAHCPYTKEPVPIKSVGNIVEQLLSLPDGTDIELHAPIFQIPGEEPKFLFTEVRKQGCRTVIIDEERVDLTEQVPEFLDGDPKLTAVVDKLTLSRTVEKQLKAAVEQTLRVGDSLLTCALPNTPPRAAKQFLDSFGSQTFDLIYGDIEPDFFMFNNPESACRTCGGIGTAKITHRELLITNPERSIKQGCFLKDAYTYKPDTHGGYVMYSLCQKFDIAMDAPWESLGREKQDLILYGDPEHALQLQIPPESKKPKERWLRWKVNYSGVAGSIERYYRRYRQQDIPNTGMEAYLDRVMVEQNCADCATSRLRPSRLLFRINEKNIHDIGQMNFGELQPFLNSLEPSGDRANAGRQVLNEITKRIDLLLGIGLDYLNLNRTSGTLSGGESQRIRLSTQIGSGLMGMLYVLDEPSIGLHPRDNQKMISTLCSLRDLGNTVIVVEHDEETIRAADHLVEVGPGPGIHGGEIVVQGSMNEILDCHESPTGQYLSGRLAIETPNVRRDSKTDTITVRGARENNLKNIDVDIPLHRFICITGASGSGKSSLINEILYKSLWKRLVDSRSLAGDHDRIDGIEKVTGVVNIDQTPIGRNSRSNPSTYVGVYNSIRDLFAKTDYSKSQGYKPGRFSFNVKGGRCEECQGEGTIATKLYFMPDVEVICSTCKGQRFNEATLLATYKEKNIADVLDMSIEDSVPFFEDERAIQRKLKVLDDLGLGYLTLGQSSTTLSGGEAQRVKLGAELAKIKRGGNTVYILDEPTTGLHLADITNLIDTLNQLVDSGHTVIVIEHHLDVIKSADHVIDLGPDGGRGGGEIIATGTPEIIAATKTSYTGKYLAPHL